MKKRQIFTDTEYAMRKWKMKREELSDALAPYISPVVWKNVARSEGLRKGINR